MAEQRTPLQPIALRRRPKIERRAWVPMSKEIRGEPMTATDESDTAWLGTIRDVSSNGIALILKRPFEPGTLLFVDLSANPNPVLQRRPVRVVHATPEEEGGWIVGCLFASPIKPKRAAQHPALVGS
jgi:PilZ domain